MIVQNVQRGVK